MKRTCKRVVAALSAIVLAVGLLPIPMQVSSEAYANNSSLRTQGMETMEAVSNPSVVLGYKDTFRLNGWEYNDFYKSQKVYYGGQYNVWNVIGLYGDGVPDHEAFANRITLLYGNADAKSVFADGSNYEIAKSCYGQSSLRTLLENELHARFNDDERAALASRTLDGKSEYANKDSELVDYDGIMGDSVNDAKIWPLSHKEAKGLTSEVRNLGDSVTWWLRTPGYAPECYSDQKYRAMAVTGDKYDDGTAYAGYATDTSQGVRPAIQLDVKSILFLSAAGAANGTGVGKHESDGELGLQQVEGNTSNEWKATLYNSRFDGFKASGAIKKNSDVTVQYSGALTSYTEGSDTLGTCISAIIKDDSGNVKYYGRLAYLNSTSPDNGELTFSVKDKYDPKNGDALYVFNETTAGGYSTDFASSLNEIDREGEQRIINKVEITVERPKCGTKVVTNEGQYKYFDYKHQTNAPALTFPANAGYSIDSSADFGCVWVPDSTLNGNKGFTETLTADKSYLANVQLRPIYTKESKKNFAAQIDDIDVVVRNAELQSKSFGESYAEYDGVPTTRLNVLVKVTPVHDLVKRPAIAPTSKSEGMKAHYECLGCGKLFADADGKTEVTKESLVIPPLSVTSLSKAKVSGLSAKTYTGKPLTPVPRVKLNGKTLTKGIDFRVSYKKNVKVGTASVTIVGKGRYTGKKTATFKIKKAKNSATASKRLVEKSFKVKQLRQKARTVSLPRVTTKFGKAKWQVVAADETKTLSLKSGKIKVKKGAAKGAYAVKLKAAVPKTSNYAGASTKTVTVRVTVS